MSLSVLPSWLGRLSPFRAPRRNLPSSRKKPRNARRISHLTLELLEVREMPALSFLTQPVSTATGQIIAPVQVHSDAGMNIPVTLAISGQSTSGSPLLGGTITKSTDASGNVTFSDLFVYGGTGKDCTLTATATPPAAGSPLDVTTSAVFQVKPGGDHLYLSNTITTTAAGASLGTITVQLLDVNGVLVFGDNSTVVQLFVQNNPGGAQFRDATIGTVINTSLTPITATLNQGVATFTSPVNNPLALDKAGIGYTLGVVATNNSGVLPGTSNAFVITAGAPSKLSFLVQPTFTDQNVVTVGQNSSGVDITQGFTINEYNPQPSFPNAWTGVVVAPVDQFGNQVTSGVTGSVTMTTNGQFNGSATTTAAINPNTGVATFTNLQWNGNVQLPTQALATSGATTITVLNTGQLLDGMAVVTLNGASGIQDGTTITKNGSTQIILSKPLTADIQNDTQLAFNFAGSNFTLTATAANVTFNSSPVSVAPATSNPFGVAINMRTKLAFVPGFVLPATAQVRTALPVIKVQVLDVNGQLVKSDNTDQITISGGGLLSGTLTQTVVGGVATFDDLAFGGQKITPGKLLTFPFQSTNIGALAPLNPQLTLTAGPAYNLSYVNPFIVDGVTATQPVTAGKYIKGMSDLGNSNTLGTLEVDVVDQDGNIVTTDNTTVVGIGLLPNEGRGPVFIGQSTTEGANTPITAPTDPNDPKFQQPANSYDFQATRKAVNGRVLFDNLYINFVGNNYILSAGTTSFATHAGTDSKPFQVVAAQAAKLVFANQVDASNAETSFNSRGSQPISGVTGVVVAALDKFGNLASGFNKDVTLALQPVPGGGTGALVGTTVTANQGFAIINQSYIDDTTGPFGVTKDAATTTGSTTITVDTTGLTQGMIVLGPGIQPGTIITAPPAGGQVTVNLPATAGDGTTQVKLTFTPNTYILTASDPADGLTGANAATSNLFAINKSVDFSGSPGVKIDPIGNQTSGQDFTVTVHLQNGGTDTNAYNGKANVRLELRDGTGNLLINPPVTTLTYNADAKPDPTSGIITYTVRVTVPSGTKGSTLFTLLAFLDLHAQTAKQTFDPPDPGSGSGDPPNGTIIQYGLGSLTTNFDTISSFPVYQALPVGGQSFPPVVGFDPARVTATNTPPALQQPNVADGFNQVPESSKWWSSLIFPRSKVAATDIVTPQDSQKDQLFALNAYPFTAMVNSNGSFTLTGTFAASSNTITLAATTALTVGATVTGPAGFIEPHTTITKITNTSDMKSTVITVTSPTAANPIHLASDPSGTILTFNNNFAGLGLSYLTDLFVLPSKAFNDPPPPFVPAGQPQAWANPQAPGAERWFYNWDGNGNTRLYQDFSVGLVGVQADGKVLSYSDWTATLDWQGNDLSNNPQELQATLGEGLPFVYFTVPTSTDANGTTIQLVTSPKNNFNSTTQKQVPVKVTVTAYNQNGSKNTTGTGTGPFEMEISYQLHDVLDEINQLGSTNGTNSLTVQDSTDLLVGMSVVGSKGEIPAGTTITGIVDATHVTISTSPAAATGVQLTFNSISGPTYLRSFDNFYGMYLPNDVNWSLAGKDENGNATFTAKLSSHNYFSVATLPGGTPGTFNPAFTTFLPHAYTFVTGSTSSFSFDQTSGIVTTTYALQTQVMQTMPGNDTGPLQALNATQYNNLGVKSPNDPNDSNELQLLKNFNTNGSLNYVSAHGELLLWNGPVFHTQLQYTGVLPDVPPLPNGLSGTGGDADLWFNYLLPVLRSVSSKSQSDGQLFLDLMFPTDNNYLQAQAMYGAAQLVPMLLEVSQSTDPGLSAADKAEAATYAELVYNAVKDRMSAWLSANDDQAQQILYYQTATPQETNPLQPAPAGSQGWQALLSIQSGFLSSETLNDQQLITGYFLKTAAFLAQYDPSWGQTTVAINDGQQNLQGTLGDIVNLMVSNVSNYDRSSNTFPFLRNFDVWAMHSWADGAANDNVGTNLESSSEAMNYDAGLIMWGQATGNQSLRNLGVYLYTTELEGVNTYWFSIKNKTDPFGHPTNVIPQQYLGSPASGSLPSTQRTIVTKMNSNGGAYVGFIGFQTSRVAGIQFLPFSGSAYYLGQDPTFVATTFGLAQKGATAAGVIPVLPPTYQSLLLPYEALTNPSAALSTYKQNINQIAPINPLDLIDNNAFNIHWIETLQAYGQVDTTVTADTVSYAVFQQPGNGPRTFVAYNPSPFEITVHFRLKGSAPNSPPLLTVTVAPHTTGVFDINGNSLVKQTDPNYSLPTPQNRFFFTTSNGQPGVTYGKTGTGESSIAITDQPVSVKITGLTGSLQGQSAVADFQMWFDPQFRKNVPAPVLTVTITYDQFGDGKNVLTQTFDNFTLSSNPGYVEYRSEQAGGTLRTAFVETATFTQFNPRITVPNVALLKKGMLVTGPGIPLNTTISNIPDQTQFPGKVDLSNAPTANSPNGGASLQFGNVGLFTNLVNGSVTITIVPVANMSTAAPVIFRTDAAGQQGRVSFFDLPYNFTTVGTDATTQKPIPVSQLNLGGPIFGPPLPNFAGVPLTKPVKATGSAGWQAQTVNTNQVTLTATGAANQTLQITVDANGFLMNNRFAAGDPIFKSPYDFGLGANQRLPASGATITIVDANSDPVILGSNNSPASTLLATIQVSTSDGMGSLFINDAFRAKSAEYTIGPVNNGVAITAAGLNVTLQGAKAFTGGVSLTTGRGADVAVLATRAGEQLTLDSGGGRSTVNIGDGNAQKILGTVKIANTSSGGFTDLTVDNQGTANFSADVLVSKTALTGLTPAPIIYTDKSVAALAVLGGANLTEYSVTGSLGGSFLFVSAGSGVGNSVVVSNNGVVNDASFPETLVLLGFNGLKNSLLIDDSKGVTPTDVVVTKTFVSGFTFHPIQLPAGFSFDSLEADMGSGGNTLVVQRTGATTVSSAGSLSILPSVTKGDLTVTGTGTVTVNGPISTSGGKVIMTAPTIQVNQAINTGPGSGGTVVTGAGVAPPAPNTVYQVGAGSILLNANTTQKTITVSAGSGQSAAVGTAFATALKALVKDGVGNPVPNVTVVFTAPNSGASGTFANGTAIDTETTDANGIATTTVFTANGTIGGPYFVAATTTGATAPANFSLTNTVGAANKLVFVQGPTTGIFNTAISPAVTVQVVDQFNNPVSGTFNVSMAIGNNPGGATLSGGNSIPTNPSGLATFNSLILSKGGVGYTLVATSNGLPNPSATSAAFDQAAQLVFIQQPSSGPANQTIAPPITVQVQDQLGNNINSSSFSVVIAIGPGSPAGMLSGTTTRTTNSNGLATFDDLSINNQGVGFTLVVSTGTLSKTSAAFNQTAVATKVAFVQQPTSGPAGVDITPPITVQVEDASNNPVAGSYSITVALGNNPTGATLSGTLTRPTNSNGLATFDDLVIDLPGTGYTLTATSGILIPDTSAAFNQSGIPTSITVTGGTSPQSATVNQPFTPFQALVVDSNNNPVRGANVVFAAPNSGPSGTFVGGSLTETVMTNANGIAISSIFTANTTAGGAYNVTATVDNFINTLTANFSLTNLAGAATSITVFSGSPQTAKTGSAFAPLQALVTDSFGNPISGASVVFTAPAAGASGTFQSTGTNTETDLTGANGVATTSAFTANATAGGPYTVSAVTGALTAANFSLTNIASTATSLSFSTNPTSRVAGVVISPAITVQADVAGTYSVTLSFGNNPSGATLGGTTTVTTNAAGLATFNNITVSKPGTGYTLMASSGGLTPASSSSFSMSATQLVFIQQPTSGNINTPIGPVTVQAQNSLGQPLSGISITMAIGNNPGGGTLGGTTTLTTGGNGRATFSNLTINKQGPGYTLVATSSTAGTTPFTSQPFDQAGPATQVTFVQQPTTGVGGVIISPPITVQVQDSSGDAVFGTFSVTMGIAVNPGGATLGGTTTVTTNASGLATFSNLTLNQVGNGYRLQASSGSLTPETSAAFNQQAVVTRGLFVQQPTSGVAGTIISPAVRFQVLDQFSNPFTGPLNVTMALGNNPSGATLGGTTNQPTNSSGVATFDNLAIDKPGIGYSLAAGIVGFVGSTGSVSFDEVSAGSKLAFVQQPTTGKAGAFISPPVTVQVTDANGVPQQGTFQVTIGFGANPGGGTLGGTLTQKTNSFGLATFNDLTITAPGKGYTLVASTNGLTGATSAAFDQAGLASQLAFVQGPTTGKVGATISPPVTVQVADALGIPVSGSFSVTIALANNPTSATLGGTTTVTTNASGLATFNNLTVNKAGIGYTLTVSSGGLSGLSGAFNQVGAPANMVIAGGSSPQSATVKTAFAKPLQVLVTDSVGNPVSGVSVTFVAPTIGASGKFANNLTSETDTTDANGIATSSIFKANALVGSYTVTASATSLTPVSFSLSNTPAAIVPIIVAAPDAGFPPEVKAFNKDGSLRFDFLAYGAQSRSGVRVAVGDVNNDGVLDIITAPGPGGGSVIEVFDGRTGNLFAAFAAITTGQGGGFVGQSIQFGTNSSGTNLNVGFYVAAGDVNGDGFADVIIGFDGSASGPLINIYSGKVISSGQDPALLGQGIVASYNAFPPPSGTVQFHGGVRVAAGDFDGDGSVDVVAVPGVGGGPLVSIYSGTLLSKNNNLNNAAFLISFNAYPTAGWPGTGLFVAVGDVGHDGVPDLIIGPGGSGGGPSLLIISGRDLLAQFQKTPNAIDATVVEQTPIALPALQYSPPYLFPNGIRVGTADLDGDGFADILLGGGPGNGSMLDAFLTKAGGTATLGLSLDAFGSMLNGIFVAGGPA